MGSKTGKKTTSSAKAKTAAPSSPKPRILRLEQFVHIFKDSVKSKQDIRYCFVLGSGASITSGVDSGATLVDWWLTEMQQVANPAAPRGELQSWTERAFKDLKEFTWDTRASFYGHVYNRRFPDNANGQSWLRKLMENKSPAFGYTVLARILSGTQHDLVITTNFDNLVHDALVGIGKPRAFIAHSPEDARFLANHDNKPRIIKLHGDIDRETYNASSLIEDLHNDWIEPLRHLLGAYTPIFIGYGGSDPGLMRFLNHEYHSSNARPRPIWAYRVSTKELKATPECCARPPGVTDTEFCRNFLQAHEAFGLPTPGFDELMVLVGHALEYPHGGKELRDTAELAAKNYEGTLINALKAARLHEGSLWCAPLDEMTRRAEQALLGEVKRRRWSEWKEYIDAAVTPSEEAIRCEEALVECPQDPRTHARLAWSLYRLKSSDPQVVKLFEDAKKLASVHFSNDSEVSLSVRNLIANWFHKEGKDAQAETEHRAVIEIRQRLLGPEHADTLGSRNNLSISLRSQGKFAEAEAENRAVMEIRQKLWGPDHPETLASRSNLVSILIARSAYSEAEKECRSVIVNLQRVLGPSHPSVIESRMNLATCLGAQGKFPLAIFESHQILQLMLRVFGPKHMTTLGCRTNLATLLRGAGRQAEAISEYQNVISILETSCAADHPQLLGARSGWAVCLSFQGKHPEAEAEFRKLLAIQQNHHGPTHPEVLAARDNLANALNRQGKYSEALAEFQDLLKIRREVMGPEHLLTLWNRVAVAGFLGKQGKHQEEEAELRAVVEIMRRTQGEQHSDVSAMWLNIAVCLKNQKKKPDALALARTAFEGLRNTLGESHPNTQKAQKLIEKLEGME